MKLYNSGGPNPRMVRMFMAEKGATSPRSRSICGAVRIGASPISGSIRPARRPALVLEDGTVIGEIAAICEDVDEMKKERLADRRRAGRTRRDPHVDAPRRPQHRRAGHQRLPLRRRSRCFENRVRCIPGAADELKATARGTSSKWLDGLMGSEALHCRRQAHHGRHPAVRLSRLHGQCRPAARSRVRTSPPGLVA